MDSLDELVWKESFFKDDFNVDNCLSKYTLKCDLETLRNDLKNYGNELHQRMAEILKTETEAIVNLAEYLTNLSSKIDDLSLPINQLREEIKTLFDLIRGVQASYLQNLESIKNNSSQCKFMQLQYGIVSSALYINEMMKTNDTIFDDSIALERVVSKYCFDVNYLESINSTTEIKEIDYVGNKLTDMVNKIFLYAVKKNDDTVVLRCLRMYDNLGEHKEAEKTYQINVVRPALKKFFTENYLESCHQDLSQIYDEALQFADTKLTFLSYVTENNDELQCFNFILNSFWIEVDKLSREGLPNITAPGNPDLFQQRFKCTWNFLQEVALKCGDLDLISDNQSMRDHLKRFNLPVYFEIRFQQIAAQLEADAILKPGPLIYEGSNQINCNLKLTLTLWKVLNRSFSPDVFIFNLGDQFMKLAMLLLARYLKWFETALEECSLFSEGTEAWEDFIIKSIQDLTITQVLIGLSSDKPPDVNDTVYRIMPKTFEDVLFEVLRVNTNLVAKTKLDLQNHLIHLKSNESFAHLQSVGAIPRLYRRTNRSVPKDASLYMVEALRPILIFSDKYKNSGVQEIHYIVDSVIENNTKQYQSLVEEVLRSVCKTEESLKRLKNRSSHIPEAAPEYGEGSGTMSDEMKIREQIKLDVCFFVEKLYPLASDASKGRMDELKNKTC